MADYSSNFLISMNGYTGTFNEGDPEPDPKPTKIPLPDYKNPESRLGYAKQFTQKYGPLMSGRGDTPLRINEKPAWGSDTSKNISIKAAQSLGLDPALIYSSAMEEGMSGIYPHKFKGRESEGDLVQSSGDKDYPVSGFTSFGLDTFADAYPGLVKKGYLPADFQNQFKKSLQVNEKDEEVNSADFKTADAALMAKAAMIKASEDEVGETANKNNIKLSPRAKQFFTLISYNAGSGNAQKMMREYAKSGYLKDDKFLEKRPSESWKVPYENVIRRMKMASALKQEGYFDESK